MTTKISATTSGLTETVDTSGILEFQTNNSSALIIGTDQNANFSGTTAITVPNGTTAQRPTPVNGMMRYNTTLSIFEVYANNTWSAANVTPTPVNTVAPVISGSAIVGQNLTSTTGTWSGSPSAYYYQWRANSTAISNATSNVFSVTLAELGANITCNVTAFNVAGNSTPATSNSLGPVIQGVTVSYLIVAGGGGGGTNTGGGGGGGGLLTGSTLLQAANTYSITIGAGGIGGLNAATPAYNGGNTTAFGFTAVGGGAAGSSVSGYNNGSNGGSGGGATGRIGTYTGGSATVSQGYAGGNTTSSTGGAGGGGAGQAGFNGTATNNGGNGGNGASYSISGTATYYAGGGGGGGVGSSTVGTGGLGGGGAGANPPAPSYNTQATGVAGTANLGGGGGGGGDYSSNGGNGGSGVVIISYAGAQQFGGGVVSSVGGNTIHTFYTSGSLVPLTALNSSYIIVGGGGGGGAVCGGGGGGGGFYSGSNVTIDANSTYTIIVGAGGTAGPTAASSFGGAGGNSTFSMTSNVAIGGGYGGGGFYSVAAYNGGNGASGGGGGGYWSGGQTTGGTGTAGQGFNGGNALNGTGYPGGGGGGFSSAGANATASQGGNGGNGVSSSISGTLTYYAGGGGGGTSAGSAGAAGLGGAAGSGSGAGSSASAGTGGGGGGGNQSSAGGAGGSGTVIISYPGSTPMMAGGNVTVVSNTVVHTFTSSGYLTPFVNFNNSLRFRSSASASLNRTAGVPTSNIKWTWSGWVKLGAIGGNSTLFSGGSSSTDYTLVFYASGQLYFLNQIGGSSNGYVYTNAYYRDPSAWYHVVCVYDSAQASASNRWIVYVNGVQQSLGVINNVSQNESPYINKNTYAQYIARNNRGDNLYLDGYMSEINFVDGQALTPNAFGSFNQYGVWTPVRYSGSYGNNGFYLPFNPNTLSYAGYFNGSSQYLSIADNAALQPGSGAWTVEFFVNVNPSVGGSDYEYYTKGAGIQIYISSSSHKWRVALSSTNTTSYFLSEDFGTPVANKWQHIAFTYDGTTYRGFVDGLLGFQSTSATLANTGSSAVIIGAYSGGIVLGYGHISNVRFVKGTAVYTSSFTPPTSPLTAISGTGLLTLQDSTIVDNSPNAFSITNTGSVTTGKTYPFATTIFNDQSPVGNNWTPNNIFGGTGANLDYMTDVPTLTSSTSANYPVLNPLIGGNNCTFSNGNLAISCGNGSTYGNTIGTMAIPSTGKWYFETIITSNAAQADWGLQSNPTSSTNRFEWYSGTIYYNGTSTSGGTYAANDVLALAIDVDGGTIKTYKNNVLQNTVTYNISALTLFPFFATGYSNTIVSYTVNFGQQPFVYTPPSGYIALNAYNM